MFDEICVFCKESLHFDEGTWNVANVQMWGPKGPFICTLEGNK